MPLRLPDARRDHRLLGRDCPICGMTLAPAGAAGRGAVTEPMRARSQAHGHGGDDSIEWEDDMVAINRQTTRQHDLATHRPRRPAPRTGHRLAIHVGDRVKIRLVNEMGSDHPMPHPFHVHGAGRFLMLSRDGVRRANLAWKDTVLVLTGQTVDILLDVTNPGLWMAHCHIAEHTRAE